MGIVYIKKLSENAILGLWHVTETVEDLLKMSDLSLADMDIYQTKKNGWHAGICSIKYFRKK